MRFFRKAKAFFLGKSEVEILSGQLYNWIAGKRLVYIDELEPFFVGIPKYEQARIFQFLKKNPNISFDEDRIHFKESETFGTESQQQLLSALIKPEFVNTEPSYIQVGSKCYQGLTCVGLPETVAEDWLSGLTKERNDVDYSIFIEPSSIQALQEYLTSELRKVRSDIYMYDSRGESNPILEQKRDELEENLKNISKGTYKLYRTHIHLLSKGLNPESAIALSGKVQASLKSYGIIAKSTTNYQQQLLKSVIPTSINHAQDKGILVPDDALAASFPFSSPFYDVDEEQGILLGWGPNNLPIARCLWKEESYSGAFIGPTGSGKSLTCKFFIDQENTIRGTRIIIIDPAATTGAAPEYRRMCEKKKGAYISFGKDSKNIPAIMGLYTGDFLEDVFSIEHILSVMLGGKEGITKAQEPWLEKGILMAFDMAGIYSDKPETWKKEPPRLDKLKIALSKLFREAKSENARMSIEALLSRLSRFTGDGMYSFIDQPGTELSLDNSFTVFEFKNTPSQIKETLTAIVMNYVKAKAMGNRDRTLIVLEEAPLWLKHEVLADFLATMIVLVRKSNTGMILVLQDLGQLENCKHGETLLGNMMFNYLMGCKKNLLRKTSMTFDLNEKEQEILLHSSTGEGILIWNKERFHVKIRIDPETYKLITTNPNDIQRYELEEQESGKEAIRKTVQEISGVDSTLEEGISLLASKVIERKITRNAMAKLPKEIKEKVAEEIKKERKRKLNDRNSARKSEKLLDYWLSRGRKNIMPDNAVFSTDEKARAMAERDYDTIKQAERFYRNHQLGTKPFHLTSRELELYVEVAKRMKNISKGERIKTKREAINEISENYKTKKDAGLKVKGLSAKNLHLRNSLDEESVKLLRSLGYQESKNDVFNFYGKPITVLGKPEGNETLQHLAYKHFYLGIFPNAQLEWKDSKAGLESDVMIALPNGKKVIVEIQSSPQRRQVIASKIIKLEESADYWIIACKKNDIKYYEGISSKKGFVCTFNQSLAIIHSLRRKNKSST
ncbi:hypothetical protein HYU13_04350 [Candidatus Woesearchaeota archaeon]|nr:hypothetical protein [Candidatus Woesearchaeota archaeon]